MAVADSTGNLQVSIVTVNTKNEENQSAKQKPCGEMLQYSSSVLQNFFF
jgi:hypothetical protein